MKVRLLLVCSLFVFALQAQILPFPVGATWYFTGNRHYFVTGDWRKIYAQAVCEKDTVIGNDHYSKIVYPIANGVMAMKPDPGLTAYLTKDSTGKMYYFRKEKLRYMKMNMQLHDSTEIDLYVTRYGSRTVFDKIEVSTVWQEDTIYRNCRVRLGDISYVRNTAGSDSLRLLWLDYEFQVGWTQLYILDPFIGVPEFTGIMYSLMTTTGCECNETVGLSCYEEPGGYRFAANPAHAASCATVGVDDPFSQTRDVQVWPNPSHGRVHLEGVGDADRLTVYDRNGRLVWSGAAEGSHDLSSLDDGLYLLRFSGATGEYTKRLLLKRD